MMIVRNIATILFFFAFLVSCQREEELLLPGDRVITFNTPIKNRAVGTAWDAGDKIGVFMVRESAPGVWETVIDDAFNKCYQTTGDGVFTPATAVDAIKAPRDGQAVNFVSYYPYRADLAQSLPCLYALDMSDQTDLINAHFMVSRNLENVMVNGGALTLDFEKPLSRIRINISSDFDAALLEGLTVAIDGVKYDKADYSLLDKSNKLSGIVESTTHTMPVVSADGVLAEASFLAAPNVLDAGGRFVFTLKDGRALTHTVANAVNFEAGKRYTYNIRLKNGGTTEEYFDVLPEQISDIAIEGGTHKLSLISKSSWTLKSTPDWLTCTPASGSGGAVPEELILTVLINNSGELLREGEIVFEDKNGALVSVGVTQKGYALMDYEAYMRYFKNQLYEKVPDVQIYPSRDIPSNERVWNFYSTSAWEAKLVIEPSSPWIRVAYKSPSRPTLRPYEDATFTIENNNSSEPREVIVKMTNYSDELIRVYKIVQQAAVDYLEASQSVFNARGKGDTFDFVVSSRGEWQAENVPSWVTLTRGTTHANKTPVTIVCAANQGAERTATFTLCYANLSQTITVSQKAKTVQNYPYSLSYSIIVHAFAGGEFKFVNGNQGTHNYANTAEIIVIPSNGENYETVKAYGPYGFVVNPPHSTEFKSSEVSGPTMALNYAGTATKIAKVEVNISYNGWTYIRRSPILNLPVPAGLTEDDKLVYTIKMTNVQSSASYDYVISYEIR